MKYKVATKAKNTRKTSEQVAVDAMFAEDEEELEVKAPPSPDLRDYTISVDDPPDAMDEIYEIEDFGLDSEESQALWELVGETSAHQFHDVIITTLAGLNGLKSAEEHINKAFETRLNIVTKGFLDDITTAMIMKIKMMFINGMDFTDEQAARVFMKVVLKEGTKVLNPLDAMHQYLSGDAEDNAKVGPYAVSTTKSFKER